MILIKNGRVIDPKNKRDEVISALNYNNNFDSQIISEIDNKYLGNLITGLYIRDIMYPIACYLLLGILISYMKEKRIFDPPAKQMKKN